MGCFDRTNPSLPSCKNLDFVKEVRGVRKLGSEAEKIMIERFGKDTVIALATAEHEVPYVRKVNAIMMNGSFYIITYALF